MKQVDPFLIVSIDTECDKSHNWRTASPLTFRGVVDTIPQRLQPLFRDFGIRPTYLISPEVMCDQESVAALRSVRNAELTTHLHGDYIVPQIKTWDFAGTITDEMQWEYGPELERAKLASLTEMFIQQFGSQPKTFRAGRFGASEYTGAILRDLGYVLDSSVTPHICWTSRQGVKRPDYRGFPEMPYTLGSGGNIWKPQAGGEFLELPVTVLPTGSVAANNPNEPIWFRPWYSDTDTLCRVLKQVLEQPAVDGVRRPLVMMFHNVELLAGASPYPQTEAEVQRYIDMMKRVFDLAAKCGVKACTMAEYHSHYFGKTAAAPVREREPISLSIESSVKPKLRLNGDLDPALKLNPQLVEDVLDAVGVQPWFKYIFKERSTRWDVCKPCQWLAQNVPIEAPVLSIGTGVGFNLFWLAEGGFTQLYGTDIDPKAVEAGRRIARKSGLPVTLVVDDALKGEALRTEQFGVIEAVNWCHLLEGFSLDGLLSRYVPHLREQGVFVIDAIDAAFNTIPGNQYHTADREKPESVRRPSEYRTRLSRKDVEAAFARHGLRLEAAIAEPQSIPKVVYIGRLAVPAKKFLLSEPPREMPPLLRERFTLGGHVGVEDWYLNESQPAGAPLHFPKQAIEECRERIRRQDPGSYGPTNLWMYEALAKFPIKGQEVAVMGSEYPWYEAMVIEYGGRPFTIEYRKITSDHPLIKAVQPHEFDAHPRQFDVAFSISSFEHDGLGRYGDPINPDGDFEAMRKMKRIVKPGGLMFLALPVGKDVLAWNAHRVYGRHRLPLLLQGWEVVASFGFSDELLRHDTIGGGENRNYVQPVFVLRNLPETVPVAPSDKRQTAPTNSVPPRPRRAKKPRVMLMADVPNWIFARHCSVLTERLSDDFKFELKLQGQTYDESKYDLLYPLEFNLIPCDQIRTPAKYVTGIRSHLSWSQHDYLGLIELLATRFQKVHAVSKRLQGMFAPFLPDVRHVTHGVDTQFFRASTRADRSPLGKLRIGWAGNRINPTKGFEQLIAPLARIPGVELVFCGYQDKNLNLQQMKEFYDSIDCYVCSSSIHHEGNNNSLMEAASMERAIITTDNGAVPEYLRHRENALIIERELPNFIHAVCEMRDCPELRLKLGRAARTAVVNAFDWTAMAETYRELFWEAIDDATNWRPDNAAAARAVQPGRYAAGAKPAVVAPAKQPTKVISASALDIRHRDDAPNPFVEAENAARNALMEDPNGVKALRLLATALFGQEKWLECAQTCYRLLGLQPDDTDVLAVLAEALLRGGEPAAAAEVLAHVLKLQPDNTEAREALAGITQVAPMTEGPVLTAEQENEIVAGLKALETDDFAGALRHYEAATRLGQSNPELDQIVNQLRGVVSQIGAESTPAPTLASVESPHVADPLPSARSREAGWSFCIITNGKRPAKLLREIDSIRALKVPTFEILVGGAPPEGLPGDVGQVPAIDAAQNGRLGEMRNKLTAVAKYDHLVVVDDDFIFHSDFIQGIESCGDDWDVLCPRILNPDGSRYWDWATQGGPKGHSLLEYSDKDENIYVTGGLCVMKAAVSDRVKWDDHRGFYQGEDLDFSSRLRDAGIRIGSNPASTTMHDDGHYTREDKTIRRREAEVGLPVRWLAPFFNPSGYASEAINFASPVSKRTALGIHHDNALTSEKFVAGLPEEERAILFNCRNLYSQIKCGVVVSHNPANGFRKLSDGEYHIGRSMFETDTIPKGWAESCNRMDEVWVPSQFNVETFARAGVHRDKLVIMPGAVDSAFFNPERHTPLTLPNRARFNFLSIFEWSSRKGWDAMIAAYLNEFSQDDDVCLYLRTYLFSKPEGDPREALNKRIQAYIATLGLGKKPLPRIEIIADQVPNHQLPALYMACDCYLAPSRGEGWGRPQHEAMLMERAVIATNWSANTEFMNAENSYLLDYELVEARGLEPELWHYKGQRWANPSVSHLRQLMRRVEQNPTEARQKGVAARKHMATYYSREAVGDLVIRRLQAIERQFASPVLPAALARQLHPSESANDTKTRNVALEGSFLDYGSLSNVNRELAQRLSQAHGLRLSPVGPNVLVNGHASDPELQRVVKTLVRKAPSNTEVTIRHSWPPSWQKPAQGKWVLMQPWEFGAIPREWSAQLGNVDQVWANSTYIERMYLEAGVPAEKVKLLPLAVDGTRFRPGVAPMKLDTAKKYKFLFVGGTIHRKGPDVLLKAFLETFRRADDVCLVIKDFGANSVYTGQTLEAEIRAAQADPEAPEILYLDHELKAQEIPSLYAACDCLVHPYRGEGFGLPVLEAMACGLPVIVTGGGATDDFATDEFAYRLPAQRQFIGDTVGGFKLAGRGWWLEPSLFHLKLALKRVCTNPDQARELGRKASDYVLREWTWEKTAKTAARYLHELALQTDAEEEKKKQKATGFVANFQLPDVALVGSLNDGRNKLAAGNISGAWESVNEAIRRRPFHPEGYLLLAEIATKAGDLNLARRCAGKAQSLAPRWKDTGKALSRIPNHASAATVVLSAPPRLGDTSLRLTICLIAKNEQKFIGQCLSSVKGLADQIIVVDTGSTDSTVEIARSFGAEVHYLPWSDDFSAPRNEALRHATGDWILVLDADEELPPEQHAMLRESMREKNVMACRLPIVDAGREDEGCSHVPRLFCNAPALCYVGRIHEQVFASIETRREQWGLENKFGKAVILHHGYKPEVVKDRDKVARNLRLLEQAVEEYPSDINLLMNLGLELLRAGQAQAGFDAYQEALDVMLCRPAKQTPPELKESLYTQFATHFIGQKHYNEAIDILTVAQAREGDLTASMHFLKGLAYMETKQFPKALEQMRACLAKRDRPALTPIHPEIRKAGPAHCVAMCLRQLNQPAEAVRYYQLALGDAPKATAVRVEFAEFEAQRGEFVSALTALHHGVEIDPASLAIWKLGGDIALRQPATLEFALDWTGEAVKFLPDARELKRQRAEALLLSGHAAEAVPLWQEISLDANANNRAAAIIAEVAGDRVVTANRPVDELEVSREFVKWYRKLIQFQAESTVMRINGRLPQLSAVLPSAAQFVEQVTAAALAG